MKHIIRVSQKKLHELLMNETGSGFLSDVPAFKGGSYRTAPEVAEPLKYNFSLTEEEINFIEDILSEVNPDNRKEKDLLYKISNILRETLINKK